MMNKALIIKKSIRALLKRDRLLFSIYRRLTDSDYKAMRRQMKEDTTKSSAQVRQEMRLYRDYWHCPPDDYVRYGLFRKNLNQEELLDYVPMWHYYCVYCADAFKGVDLIACGDKLVQYKLMTERGILTPEVYAVIEKGLMKDIDSQEVVSLKQLEERINENEKVFIKPTDGGGGEGIIVLNKDNGHLMCGEILVKELSDIPVKCSRRYIVQKGIVSREDIRQINPSSLNTFRVQAVYENGVPYVVTAILRLGRSGSFLDNSGQGGLTLDINFQTGQLAGSAGRVHGGGVFYTHPDTGYEFNGVYINDWNTIFSKIYDKCSKITEYKMIGWDFAIAEDNELYAIEYNLGFGIEGTQITRGGLRRRMGIYPKQK